MERSEKLQYLIGERFERLVIEEVYKSAPPTNHPQALCSCDCGVKRPFDLMAMRRGLIKSCGCLHREQMTGNAIRKTHGEGDWRNGKRTAEYITWLGLKWRCHPDNRTHAKDYFLRGIKVCERWQKYENFLEDMGRKPGPKYEVDRFPNMDGNYEPGNCRWATEREQVLNRRNAIFTYLDGKIIPLADAANILGVPYLKVYHATQAVEWDSDADYHATMDHKDNPPVLLL